MGRRKGASLATLPAILNPEQRLTAEQSMTLAGRGRSKFYNDIKAGVLPEPERDGPRMVRWRAGDLIDALNRGRPGQKAGGA